MLHVFPSRTQGHSAYRLKFRQCHAVKSIWFVSGKETPFSQELMASSAPFLLLLLLWGADHWIGRCIRVKSISQAAFCGIMAVGHPSPPPHSCFLSVPEFSHRVIWRILQSRQTILLRGCLRDRDNSWLEILKLQCEMLFYKHHLCKGVLTVLFPPEGSCFIALVYIIHWGFLTYCSELALL